MINEIIAGVIKKLNGVFGGGVSLYASELPRQNVKTPFAIVSADLTGESRLLGGRSIRRYSIGIKYQNSKDGDMAGLRETGDILTANLASITLPDGQEVNTHGNSYSTDGISLAFAMEVCIITEMADADKEKMGGWIVNSVIKLDQNT